MIEEILLEFLKAIARMFMNPLLYMAIIMAIFLGYVRVKRERKFFKTRILWGWTELVGLIKEGIWFALIISVLSLLVGLTQSIELLFFVAAFSIFGLILYNFHLLSPMVLIGLSLASLMVMNEEHWSFEIFGWKIQGLDVFEGAAVTCALMAGILLIAESRLIKKYGVNYASPMIEKSKRGLHGVAFFTKKLWLLPIFFVVPGQAIDAYFPWWPQFSLNHQQFALVLFPFLIGFQQITRRSLPLDVYPKLSRAVWILGGLVLIGGLVGYFYPIAAVVAVFAGAIIRLFISYIFKVRERRDVYAVSARPNGVMIAAVLPESPAEKMGLQAGEIIRKVNGREVHNELELYEALQINAAYCKLEVLNHKNEVRLTQHEVYSKDHYRIGLLIIE
ncbi:PDZ domain-containing protein [Ureibacillus thermophilus]|uniref:PDZ domain-containing protein n=1 Tax=Ureibacillus thermophilus TaxID=367743 RepID=A0A4P6UQ50_9BACL|nr:PDZ domain-containing protein [Ureibacillus thermophilus]